MYYTLELLPTTPDASSFYKNQERNNENAGFDLFVPVETSFAPDEKKLVSMRVKAKLVKHNYDILPTGVHYWMPPRSSISKTGLMLCNSIGVIDASYRGELMAFLWNTTDTPVTVKKGDRLVQIVAPDMGWIKEVKVVDALDATERGEGGFGSTGR
jgi:dUTP pyrophosphatase